MSLFYGLFELESTFLVGRWVVTRFLFLSAYFFKITNRLLAKLILQEGKHQRCAGFLPRKTQCY